MSNKAVEGAGVMERAVELTKRGESFVMATVVWRQGPSSGQSGSRAIVTEDGELYGWIGGACAEPVLIREAKTVLKEGRARLIWLGQEKELEQLHVPEGVYTVPMNCQSEGALQIYVEPVQSAPRVTIVGRSPMAITLTSLLTALDWHVDLIDLADFQSEMVEQSSIVVVATQGHGDEDAVEIALPKKPVYLGVVASRKRGEAVFAYLRDRKFSEESLASITLPAGEDLGHTSHREMAVSILAQLVKMRAEGRFKKSSTQSLSGKSLPLLEPESVLDLVCGMTVEAVPANRPFVYEGVTYYFCAPGCRASFEKDPTSFINQEAKC